MSDEFILNASFTVQSQKHFEDIEMLIEHLEMNEEAEALAILKSYDFEKAADVFESVLTPYSNYQPDNDPITMYLQTYDDSVDDMDISLDKETLKVAIDVEGQDHDAADYCSALVLLLKAAGALNLEAKARTNYWQASWTENNGSIELQLKEFEC